MRQQGLPEFRDDVQTWAAALKAAGCRPRPEGAGFRASCPGPRHKNGNRKNPSLSIKQGDAGRVLATCHAGCSFEEIHDALGMDRPPPERPAARYTHREERRRDPVPVGTVERWQWFDELGRVAVTSFRKDTLGGKRCWFEPKSAKPPAGGWPLLYLPNIIANSARPILFLEGERTTDHANDLFGDRYCCTTTKGAKAGAVDYRPVEGRDCVGWPDNDDAGFRYMGEVARLCLEAGAKSFRMLSRDDLAALPDKWDLADMPPPGIDLEALLKGGGEVRSFPGPNACPPLKGKDREQETEIERVADMLKRPRPKVTWGVEGIVPAGGTVLVTSGPKVGKTQIAIAGSIAAVRGGIWLGRRVAKGPALYVAYEGSRDMTLERFRLMGVREDDDLHFAYRPRHDRPTEWLEAAIVETGARFVVLDTLFKFAGAGDPNEYAEANKLTDPLVGMAAAYECLIFMLHHQRKSGGEGGEEVLGSQALFGAVDAHISLSRNGVRRTLRTDQREGEDMPTCELTLDPETGSPRLGEPKALIRAEAIRQDVLDALDHADGPMKADDIAKAAGRKRSDLTVVLDELVTSGFVGSMGEGKRGDPRRYFLPSRNDTPDQE